MESRLEEILIIIFLLIIIIAPFLCLGLTIGNIRKTKEIKSLQEKINYLEFEQQYTEFVYVDSNMQ